MKAAVFYGVGDLRLEERVRPTAGEDEVVVRVEACGICGTDQHILHGEFLTSPPVVIGHEYAGQVVSIGECVEELSEGDRVTVDPNMACGTCRACRRGKGHLCGQLRAMGIDVDGGFAEYSCAPAAQCYRVPDGVTYLQAAMTEPLACCVHGIDLAQIVPGDTVAVIGAGAIGLLLAQLARLSGATRVILSDPLAARRSIAESLGFVEVIDPRADSSLGKELLRDGADVVLEAVGSKETTKQAIDWAAAGATVLWFGVTPPGVMTPVEANTIFQKELTIRGARINPHTHARALALLASGAVEVDPLITRTIGLGDLAAIMALPSTDDVKTVVEPFRA